MMEEKAASAKKKSSRRVDSGGFILGFHSCGLCCQRRYESTAEALRHQSAGIFRANAVFVGRDDLT